MASWQEIIDSSTDAIKAITDSINSEMSEEDRKLKRLELKDLRETVSFAQSQLSADSGGAIFQGIQRVDR